MNDKNSTQRRKDAKTQAGKTFFASFPAPLRLCAFALSLTILLVTSAARGDWYLATITVTNTAGTTNGQTYTIGADTRTWTNSVFVPATQIATNNTQAGAAQKMKIQAAAYPFDGVQIFTTTYGFTVRSNGYFPATISDGWGTVLLETNPAVATAISVAVPLDTYEAVQQTNVSSAVVAMINDDAQTNLVAAAKLGTGATSSKFLRGDQTWQTIDETNALTQVAFDNNGFAVTNIQGTNIVYKLKAAFSTNYTVLLTDQILACTGTNQVLTLPDGTNGVPSGRMFSFLMSSTTGYGSAIITNANGVQTVLSAAGLSQTITNGQSLTVIWDGANWR